LSQEYSYQKLLKSDNPSSRYSRKCRGCFLLGHSVQSSTQKQRRDKKFGVEDES